MLSGGNQGEKRGSAEDNGPQPMKKPKMKHKLVATDWVLEETEFETVWNERRHEFLSGGVGPGVVEKWRQLQLRSFGGAENMAIRRKVDRREEMKREIETEILRDTELEISSCVEWDGHQLERNHDPHGGRVASGPADEAEGRIFIFLCVTRLRLK